jgi:putative chitinase
VAGWGVLGRIFGNGRVPPPQPAQPVPLPAPPPLVTAMQLQRLVPGLAEPDAWALALSSAMRWAEITTAPRMAMFLSQCAHESHGFTQLVEVLNYSAKRMAEVWPSRYAINPGEPDMKRREPNAKALALARNPVALANETYANRMGNGPPLSGDGWRFRGRGIIQLTGRMSYTRCAGALGMALDDLAPASGAGSWLEAPRGAALSAAWYWRDRNINTLADADDVYAVTVAINGKPPPGQEPIGLRERRALWNSARTAILTA